METDAPMVLLRGDNSPWLSSKEIDPLLFGELYFPNPLPLKIIVNISNVINYLL